MLKLASTVEIKLCAKGGREEETMEVEEDEEEKEEKDEEERIPSRETLHVLE